MFQASPKFISFEEFVAWYPDGEGRYELYRGGVIEMLPAGDHEEVTAFATRKLIFEIDHLNLPYIIPRTYLVKPPGEDTGYQPDILVLDKAALEDEPRWKKSSTIEQGKSIKLAVEVVSTNWGTDYGRKVTDYEQMGIPEYWIVDFKGLGAKRYIGSPKQPTLSVYQLVENEYQVQQFRGKDRIISDTFPELTLTAAQIFSIET
ncbi:Uma2 family endonuclease [Phormidesmis sp. 146-33]